MAVAKLDERLGDAVQATILYADIFDFPLQPEEIWRDLIGTAASLDATRIATERLVASGQLARDGSFLVLPNRAGLAAVRKERGVRAARFWPMARRLGALLGTIPFVRMVAVTGSLAAENPDAEADLDYLIVTTPGRLWLVRAMAVVLVRLVRPARIQVCPNYLLTTRALKLDHQDLFTAHELLQAVPVVGSARYREMLEENLWSARWLPNRYRQATAPPVESTLPSPIQHLGETLLAGAVGDRLDAWESLRKRRRLEFPGETARFTEDRCEGHYDKHRFSVLDELRTRCERLGITCPTSPSSTTPAGLPIKATGASHPASFLLHDHRLEVNHYAEPTNTSRPPESDPRASGAPRSIQ